MQLLFETFRYNYFYIQLFKKTVKNEIFCKNTITASRFYVDGE